MDGQVSESVKTPAVAAWLEDVALRDLVLNENHAACIDAKGDVYQWGDGFFGTRDSSGRPSSSGKPALTLRGKVRDRCVLLMLMLKSMSTFQNILRLQSTADRVFALSASGRIYVVSSKSASQQLPTGAPTPASTPWWGTGWIWGEEEEVDFAEISSQEKLARGEKYVYEPLAIWDINVMSHPCHQVHKHCCRKRPSVGLDIQRPYVYASYQPESKHIWSIGIPEI